MTKKEFSDMILYKIYGGIPDSGGAVDERDIWDALDHKVNELFKLHQFDTNLPSGETIPENTMIATYEDVAVTSLGNGKATATLPIIPISLPKSMGIYLVYDSNNPDIPFIPMQRGQNALLRSDLLLNDLMGQVGYEPKNNKLIFTKDITLFGVTTVTMELCVFDISLYLITQDLPIPADYVGRIEDELIKEFSAVVAESGAVNNFTNAGQTVPNNASTGK